VPGGRKFTLELSRVTKLGLEGAPIGLDGAPIRWTLGLEYIKDFSSSSELADLGDVGGSDTTALIVGVAVGRTIISSSENSASEGSEP
jgi:hypothetical protein